MSTDEARRAPHGLWITGDPDADHLLTTSGNALLIGMVLDQRLRSPLRSEAEAARGTAHARDPLLTG